MFRGRLKAARIWVARDDRHRAELPGPPELRRCSAYDAGSPKRKERDTRAADAPHPIPLFRGMAEVR